MSVYTAQLLCPIFIRLFKVINWVLKSSFYFGVFWLSLYQCSWFWKLVIIKRMKVRNTFKPKKWRFLPLVDQIKRVLWIGCWLEITLTVPLTKKWLNKHSCMPRPLAPDPIRSSHVFGVYSEPIKIAWR